MESVLLGTGHRYLDCFAIVSRAIPNAASIEVSRASAMWRAIQINSQQPRQKNLLLGTVPGGDGISFSPQTQHLSVCGTCGNTVRAIAAIWGP